MTKPLMPLPVVDALAKQGFASITEPWDTSDDYSLFVDDSTVIVSYLGEDGSGDVPFVVYVYDTFSGQELLSFATDAIEIIVQWIVAGNYYEVPREACEDCQRSFGPNFGFCRH